MGFELSQLDPQFFTANPKSNVWNTDINFDLEKSYFIRASSGKGKSTLFKILIGKAIKHSGRALYNNQVLSEISPKSLSQFRSKEWSLMFQDLGLFEEMSVRENLEFYTDINHTYLSILELEDLDLEKSCSKLSFGERQRIALIRALSKEFNFLILDEPFSHLNDSLKIKALDLIFERVAELNASLILFDLDPIPSHKFDKELLL
jgi:putative ABC transport system ATP-binding protein